MTYDIRYQSKEERRDHSGISRVSFGSKRSSNVRKIYLWCGCPPEKKNVLLNVLAILRYGPQEAAQLTVRVQQATEMLTAQRDAKQGARKNS